MKGEPLGRLGNNETPYISEFKETEVLVIGNGPSGIVLSYMLSGWTPYYSPKNAPNEDLLHMRLSWYGSGMPITEMNMQELSEGLEGRTSNPVALVFDQLCHPYADLGLKNPSEIDWKCHSSKAVSHLVVGKAPNPGGVWQSIQGDMKTLSKASWMELPNLSFKEFLQKRSSDAYKKLERATMAQVRDYYESYVAKFDLEDNFMNGALVTSVEKVPQSANNVDDDTGETGSQSDSHCWEVWIEKGVSGVSASPKKICVRTKNIVLAIGTSDIPNRLHVSGEDLPFVKHSISDMNSAFDGLNSGCESVLVVGAGLSASDAILAASKRSLNVIHVFRETPCGNPAIMLKRLPKAIYPEYVWMYELMCGDQKVDWYKPFPQYSVKSFLKSNNVMLEDENGNTEILEISLALIQIGSSPDLSFLPRQSTKLGIVPDMNIDSKHNPIDINPFTYESNITPGLYAMGPLVGDNFVRFLKGGALAIRSHLDKKAAAKSSSRAISSDNSFH